MVVKIVDIDHVTSLEPENHAPIRPDCHRPETRIIAFESVQSKAGQVHVFGSRCDVEPGKYVAHGLPVIGLYMLELAAFIKSLERPTAKALYNLTTVML